MPNRLFALRNLNAIKALSLVIVGSFLAYGFVQRHAQTAPKAGVTAFVPSFESPQSHPLALTPDGTRLLAVNSPDGRLSVFQLGSNGPALVAEIPVGLEPVSVAARNNHEAWVVNWLSDSVSVVNLDTGNVVRTIDVGDEPTDVVFAGVAKQSAFVCVAGLNQVKAFDPDNPAQASFVININGKQPRSLSSSPFGTRIYVSVFESGNQTTIISPDVVKLAGGLPAPTPALAAGLPPAPAVALIVQRQNGLWVDETKDSRWTKRVNLSV